MQASSSVRPQTFTDHFPSAQGSLGLHDTGPAVEQSALKHRTEQLPQTQGETVQSGEEGGGQQLTAGFAPYLSPGPEGQVSSTAQVLSGPGTQVKPELQGLPYAL